MQQENASESALMCLAYIHEALKEYDKAQNIFWHVMIDYPENWQARLAYCILLNIRNLIKKEEILSPLLEDKHNRVKPVFKAKANLQLAFSCKELAFSCREEKQKQQELIQQADKYANRALKLKPDYAGALSFLGHLSELKQSLLSPKDRNHSQSFEYFEKARKIDPQRFESLHPLPSCNLLFSENDPLAHHSVESSNRVNRILTLIGLVEFKHSARSQFQPLQPERVLRTATASQCRKPKKQQKTEIYAKGGSLRDENSSMQLSLELKPDRWSLVEYSPGKRFTRLGSNSGPRTSLRASVSPNAGNNSKEPENIYLHLMAEDSEMTESENLSSSKRKEDEPLFKVAHSRRRRKKKPVEDQYPAADAMSTGKIVIVCGLSFALLSFGIYRNYSVSTESIEIRTLSILIISGVMLSALLGGCIPSCCPTALNIFRICFNSKEKLREKNHDSVFEPTSKTP